MNTSKLIMITMLKVAFLLLTVTLSAQDDSKVRLGIKAYPLVSWMSSNNQGFQNDGLRMGGRYGVVADFRIFGNQSYNFKTGLMISNLGGKLEYPEVYENEDKEILTGSARAKYRLTYLNVPLQIKLRTEEIGFSNYYLLFGGELGYNLSANVTETFRDKTIEDIDIDQHRFDDVETLRTELVIGGGMERIISGQTRLLVGISYHRGANNVLKGRDYQLDDDNRVVTSGGDPVKDRDLSTSLSYITLSIGVSF